MPLLSESVTFDYPLDFDSQLSDKIVTVGPSYNGLIAFVVSQRTADHEGALSAIPSLSSGTGPILGTASFAGDRQTVLVNFDAQSSAAGDFEVKLIVTSTDATVFEVRGTVRIE